MTSAARLFGLAISRAQDWRPSDLSASRGFSWPCNGARRVKFFVVRENRAIYIVTLPAAILDFSIFGGAKCASRWRVSLSVPKRQLTVRDNAK